MSARKAADAIILTQLKQLGCEVDESVNDLLDVDKFLLYRATVICLRAISRGNGREPEDFPEELPAEISTCFRTCNALTQSIKEYGFRGNIAFDQFLYPNEMVTRQILSWLVEQAQSFITEQQKDITNEEATKRQTVQARMNSVLSFFVNSTWTVKNQNGTKKVSIDVTSATKSWDNERVRWESTPVNTQSSMNAFLLSSLDKGDFSEVTKGTAVMESLKSSFRVGGNSNDDLCEKHALLYYKSFGPYLSEQIPAKDQLASTVFEENAREILIHKQREDEWNELGIDSGLTREEYFKQKNQKIEMTISEVLRGGSGRSGVEDDGSNNDGDLPSLSDLLQSLKNNRNNEVNSSTFAKRKLFENDTDVTKNLLSSNPLASKDKNDASIEEEKKRKEEERQKELEEMQAMLDKVNSRIDQIQNNRESLLAQVKQTEEAISEEKQRKKKLEEEFTVAKTTAVILQDKEKNIKQLETVTSQGAQRLLNLATEWEQHRKPLIERYRALKEKMKEQKNEYKDLINVSKELRDQMNELIHSIRQKEELISKKKQEYEDMPKETDRTTYVTRILDVVKNIEKQNEEISKVLKQSRELNETVTEISAKVSRTFQENEENIFKEAQKDPEYKQLYKDLVEIRSLFEALIESVQQNGKALNTIRDLENQIATISERNDTLNIEKVTTDLQMIQNENMKLQQQLVGK
nr:unnamed protein product [Naegleria fowleri]